MTRPAKKNPLSEAVLSELAGLTDDVGRSRFLARRRQLYRTSVVQQLNDAARTKLRIDTRQVLSLAEATVAIARKLRNQAGGPAFCFRPTTRYDSVVTHL